jgi:hypothetical protein
LVTAQPNATLAELRDRLRTSVAFATIWRELNAAGAHRQTKPYTPTNNGAKFLEYESNYLLDHDIIRDLSLDAIENEPFGLIGLQWTPARSRDDLHRC